jgi:hypothetical protein
MVTCGVAGRRLRRALLAVFLVLATVALSSTAAVAGEGSEGTITEDIVVAVDPLGSAHFDATLVYPQGSFDDPEFDAAGFGPLLERHFVGSLWPTISELDNFVTRIDPETSTVKASFDWQSYATFDGKTWHVYGCYAEPSPAAGTDMVFKDRYRDSAEYTFWQLMTFDSTLRVVLPSTATAVTWNGKQRVDYTLPAWTPPPPDENVLQANSDWLVPFFIALIVLSGGAAITIGVLAWRSAPAAAPAGGAAGANDLPPAFCERCGAALVPGDTFCAKCGDPVDRG